jgi:hypothetical protein
LGRDQLTVASFTATTIGPMVPRQGLVLLGGPVSAPGYDFHQFTAHAGATVHVEWKHVTGHVPISLGRYGRVWTPVTLAPFLHGVWVHDLVGATRASGVFPSAGIGLLTAFDVIRFDVARGVRDGRWTFGVDISPDLWRVF